jgi:proline iminopeptidase
MAQTEGYVPVEAGLKLYYRVVGDGRHTVIIPAASWLSADFGPLAEGRCLIFYDQRGRGQSDPDADESHVWTDYEVRDLEAIRQHLALGHVSIIGWSYMGGLVALYAADHPAAVTRLVLMCPISPRSGAPYENADAATQKENARLDPAGIQRLKDMQQAGLDLSDPEAYCRQFQAVITPRQMGKPQALAHMRSDPCQYPNEWRHNLVGHNRIHVPEASRTYDWRPRLSTLQAPTLVIHGSEDLIPLESSQEWTALLPNARLLTVAGSGHYPHLEAPEIYFPAVDQFLRGTWPDGAEPGQG